MLAILLLPLVAQAQAGAITFSAPAAPALRLLPELGRKMNLNLGADRFAGATVLLLDVREMPRDRLLTTIAKVADAEWEREGNRLRLVRPQTHINRLWREDAARRRNYIANALARDRARLEKDGPITMALTHQLFDYQVRPKLPGESIPMRTRGALEAALVLGPDTLASIRAGQRVVFALNPNPGQRPLTNDLLATAIRAQKDLIAYEANLFAQKPPKHQSLIFPEVEAHRREAARAHIVVARPLGTDDLVVWSRRFNAAGMAIGESSYPIRFPVAKVSPGAKPIEVGPLVREIVERTETSDRGRFTASAELAATLADPERNEPLELMFGPPLRDFANGRDIVACLPDSSFKAARQAFGTGEIDFTTLLAKTDLGVQVADNLVEIKPLRPALAHQDAVPRDALKPLIASLRPAGHLRIEAIVAYDRLRPQGPRPGTLDWEVLEALLGARMTSMGDGRVEFHRFDFGLLAASFTPQQWRIMEERGLEPDEISPLQQTYFIRGLGINSEMISLERDGSLYILHEGMDPAVLASPPRRTSMQCRAKTEPYLEVANSDWRRSGSIPPGSWDPKANPNARYYAGYRRVMTSSFWSGSPEQRISFVPTQPMFDITIQSGDQPVAWDRLSPEIRAHFHLK